jgi:putative tributyrin esterase
MALLHVNYFSEPLQKQSGMFVVKPDSAPPYYTVYLLHGMSDDYTIWQRRTSIERYADKFGMMIVMLDGARMFYTDTVAGVGKHEAHVLETVNFIDDTFRTKAAPEARGIQGLSMGGYGAMKIGLKQPEIFGSIVSHSGALDVEHIHRNRFSPEITAIFGTEINPDEDCFELAKKAKKNKKLPNIRFDCGVDDFLIQANRDFDLFLTKEKIKHEYEEFPGEHNWDYWDLHVQDGLRYHRAKMK